VVCLGLTSDLEVKIHCLVSDLHHGLPSQDAAETVLGLVWTLCIHPCAHVQNGSSWILPVSLDDRTPELCQGGPCLIGERVRPDRLP
jgi:hypothetical protein